jgi:putative protein-disulfide isomerase
LRRTGNRERADASTEFFAARGTATQGEKAFPKRRSTVNATLYYVHDPMCSWCWAFRPVWTAIAGRRPPQVALQRVLGGLAADTREPMPESLQLKIQDIWRTIQRQVPGTAFNFAFWQRCRPRRSTYPACRAVIAATRQGARFEEAMILKIQTAYYLEARNPSDDATLVELASEIGLDAARFAADLNADATREALRAQIDFGHRLGASGFPSLILEHAGRRTRLRHDYRDADTLLPQITAALDAAGRRENDGSIREFEPRGKA